VTQLSQEAPRARPVAVRRIVQRRPLTAFFVLSCVFSWWPGLLYTISTDDNHTLNKFRTSVGALWTFLSDPGRIIQKDLAIQEYTDPEHDPMIPHTLVLKPRLVIHSVYNGYWFWAARRSTTCGSTCAR
jgi:hypothetical protein